MCQSKELNYWNAIILHDFKAIAPKGATTTGMDGPLIVGSDLTINNYYVNSEGNIHCQSQYNETIPLAEYGLYMNNKAEHSTPKQHYQIKDAIVSGSIQLHGENKVEGNAHGSFHNSIVRPMQSCRLLVNSSPHQEKTPSIATYENITKKTSLYLALQKATHTLTKEGQIKSVQPHDNDNDKYYYFNFASCQNNALCDVNTDTTYLSDPSVFSQATDANVAWPTDKPIVFNIPVARNSTFKLNIPQAFISQLPACNTVWNFFSVDEQGVMDESAEQSFTVNRTSDTMIGGTFLAPFGSVVDGPSGGFAGQLIASNYESRGASLYDFEAIDASCHIASASCWPHLRRDDDMSTEAEPEQVDDFQWMIRRGRQLLPVTVQEENQSASTVAEISKPLASTTTTTEIVLPSKAVIGSTASSMLSEYSSLLDVLIPQQLLDVEGLINQDNAIANPENDADMDAFAEHPILELPADFNPLQERPKTTVTFYVGTRTMTYHTSEQITMTVPFSKVNTLYSTNSITSYTGTETFTVTMLHEVEASPTGVSFDLVQDRVVTLY
ncbi:hypothetical protein MAM1_0256d08810 [Mucor ambiguus]|uniref:Choice-of-anchor A domain-containing protein n=1 Tax=Mucor ambiguus TaxID=91626 RepID=A0A0C9LWX5_9FUNG|nr:hypothetical protein MAM1_0256d08810 [Mucor ambiguus]